MAFTHVLVPTDFSDPANRAWRFALEEATLHHARVTLLHVLPAHAATDVYYVAGDTGPSQEAIDFSGGGSLRAFSPSPPSVIRHDPGEVARNQLRDLMRGAFHGPWDVKVTTGQPADAIV